MELLICGTGAAEGWPALFCSCAVCAEARRRGGKDRRSRAAYMLGDTIRIDFGPDSFYHQQQYGLGYERLEALLFSHAHDDHLLPRELHYRRPGFSAVPEAAVLSVYGNARVEERLEAAIDGEWDRHRLRFQRVAAFDPIPLPGGVTAIPVPADHDRTQECVNFLFEVPPEVGGEIGVSGTGASRRPPASLSRLLIAHDSGWYDEPSWEFLAERALDLVLLDCTGGARETRRGHMSCAVVCEFRDRLREQGSLAPGARVIATHFSHNGGWLHHQLEAYLNPRGIEAAYDGMRCQLGAAQTAGREP